MIYRNSYFNKEMRQAYIENRISGRRKLAFGAFLGLITFVVHFVLQTLTKSVLYDIVPYIMQTTYFSTVYTYVSVYFLLYILYFLVYYDYLSFAEIRKNRWYLLVKMGYSPQSMIFTKTVALFFSFVYIYTVGFSVAVLMTFFLNYPFTHGYLMTLFLVGFIDIAVITALGATVSLFTSSSGNARYSIFFSAVLLYVLKVVTGYRDIITVPDLILKNGFLMPFLPKSSLYTVIALGIVVTCFVLCFIRAKVIARYYSLPFSVTDEALPAGVKLARINGNSGRFYFLDNVDRAKRRGKIFDITATSLLIVFVCAAVIFNVFIIVISSSQPGKEVTLRGAIPYVIKSDTMTPEIHMNDLAYFKRVDDKTNIDTGTIVLFMYKNEVFIQRLIKKEGDQYTVDIDNYPNEQGIMIKEVERTQIYGVYSHRNRWLGALILFANSIAGRIVFLFIPVLVLFFYKQIRLFFKKTSRIPEND